MFFEDTYPIFPGSKCIGICTVIEYRHLMYMLGILVQVSVITWILSRFMFFLMVMVSNLMIICYQHIVTSFLDDEDRMGCEMLEFCS